MVSSMHHHFSLPIIAFENMWDYQYVRSMNIEESTNVEGIVDHSFKLVLDRAVPCLVRKDNRAPRRSDRTSAGQTRAFACRLGKSHVMRLEPRGEPLPLGAWPAASKPLSGVSGTCRVHTDILSMGTPSSHTVSKPG